MPDTSLQPPKQRDPVELTYQYTPPPPRPLIQRVASSFRSWLRHTFSRDSFITSLKSLIWVGPLTVLIWIYAEQDQFVTTDLNIIIAASTNDAARVTRILSPSSDNLRIFVEGPRASTDRVKDLLQAKAIPITADRNLPPGEHAISIVPELNRLPEVVDSGVTVVRSDPAEIQVRIDPIKKWDLEVRVRSEDLKLFATPPVFSPAKVKLTGPESVVEKVIKQLQAQGQTLDAVANLSAVKAELAKPGKHPPISVPVMTSVPIVDPAVMLEPATVAAYFDVANTAEHELVLPYVRVLAAFPPDVQKADQYKPVYNSTIAKVTVYGPEQQIALLQEQKYIPAAIFEVSYDSIDNPAPAPLMFQLPPGVHVSDPDAQRRITYSFKPRVAEPQ
jgi:hypothetical protein